MTFARAWNESLPTENQLANQLCVFDRELEGDWRERFSVFPGNFVVPGSQETPDAVFGDANRGVLRTNSNKLTQRWDGSTFRTVRAGHSIYSVQSQAYTDFGSGPSVSLVSNQSFSAPGKYIIEAFVFTTTPTAAPDGVGATLFAGPNLGVGLDIFPGQAASGYFQIFMDYPVQNGTATLRLCSVRNSVSSIENGWNFGIFTTLPFSFNVPIFPGAVWPAGLSFTAYGPFVRIWSVSL